MSAAGSFNGAYDALDRMVGTAHERLAAGEVIDLARLSSLADTLFSSAGGLPLDDPDFHARRLIELVGRLDRFGEELARHYDELTTRLDDRGAG